MNDPSTPAQGVRDAVSALLRSIESEELAADEDQVAYLRGARDALDAVSQFQGDETLAPAIGDPTP